MRYIDFREINKIKTRVDVCESVRQIWESGKEWRGFSDTMRPMSGISVFVSDVKGVYTFEDRPSVTARKGDIVYIPKGEKYKVRFLDGGFDPDVYTVNFNLFDFYGEEILLEKSFALFSGISTAKIEELAARLSDAMLFEDGYLKIQSLFFAFLNDLSYLVSSNKQEYNPVSQGAELICAEWNKNRRISEYAEICGISEGGFYLHFKAWYGKSPVEYRNGIRINSAISLLINTDLQISEIAMRCGFDDAYYFSRIFKKIVGISPREYRRKAQ